MAATDEPAKIKSTRSVRLKLSIFMIWAQANKREGSITAAFKPKVLCMYRKIMPLKTNSSQIPAVIPKLNMPLTKDIQKLPGFAM